MKTYKVFGEFSPSGDKKVGVIETSARNFGNFLPRGINPGKNPHRVCIIDRKDVRDVAGLYEVLPPEIQKSADGNYPSCFIAKVVNFTPCRYKIMKHVDTKGDKRWPTGIYYIAFTGELDNCQIHGDWQRVGDKYDAGENHIGQTIPTDYNTEDYPFLPSPVRAVLMEMQEELLCGDTSPKTIYI